MPLCKPESSLGGSWWEEKQRDENFVLQKHKTGIWAYRFRIILAANNYVVAKAKSEEEIGRDWALLQTTSDKMKVHGTLSKEGVVSFFVRFWQQYRNDAASGLVSPSSVLRQDTETSLVASATGDHLLGGRTALHLAASRGDLAAVNQLLAERKDGEGVSIDQIDSQGWTALHCACEGGHLEVCDALLQNGADPSIPTNDGNLALHYVASQPPRLRPGKARGNLYAEAEEGESNGNDNGDDEEGGSFKFAIRRDDESGEEDDPLYIRVLLRMLTGVNVNTRNYQGETALHKAVLRGSRSAVDLLMKCSHADVNACNQYGETPLFYGIRRNAPSIVRTLLWYGADKDFVGPSGTPVEVAMQIGLDYIVSLIEGTPPAEAPSLPRTALAHEAANTEDDESAETGALRERGSEELSEETPTLAAGDSLASSPSGQKRERRGWGAWRELARKAVGSTGLGSLRREKARGVWKVFITSYTGKYLTARPDGRVTLTRLITNEGAIVPMSSPPDGAEGQMWLLQRVSKGDDGGEDQYALRSSYGKYLRASLDGGLRAEREVVGDSETWTGVDRRLRVLSFRSRYSRYMCSHPGGRVRADSETAEEWEEWSIHDADGERGVMRDVYGFVVPRQEAELYERFVAKYYNKKVPLQRREWRKYLASYDLEKEIQNDSPQLKKIIRTVGIPPEKRRKLWYKLSGAEGKASVSTRTYADLVKQAQGHLTSVNVEVERDVARTFPTHSYFREDEAKNALTRVLSAYAVWNPSLGYCQSMNFIAGLLLLVTDEEGAFWLLSKIVEDLLVDYFTPSMLGLLVDQQVLAALVRARMPGLYSHLSAMGVPVHSFTTKWLMCIFADTAPTETVLRIWDFLFTDGSHILFLLVYSLFKTHQATIMRLTTAQEIVNLLKQTLHQSYEPDSWFKMAFDSLRDNLLTSNNLSSMRQTYLSSILQEQKLHSKKKDILALQQHTSFSADELERLHTEYDALTAASLRNRLELYDFPFVLHSISPNWSKAAYSRVRGLFELFDRDGDGILSFHELALGLSPLVKGPLDALLQMFFRLYGQRAPETEPEPPVVTEVVGVGSGGGEKDGEELRRQRNDQQSETEAESEDNTAADGESEAKDAEDGVASNDEQSTSGGFERAKAKAKDIVVFKRQENGKEKGNSRHRRHHHHHGDLDDADSESDEEKRRRQWRRKSENGGGLGSHNSCSGGGGSGRAHSTSASGASSLSTSNNSCSASASSYERRREERERLEEGVNLVLTDTDFAELVSTLRLVYGPVLAGFSVGSGDSLIANDLFLRQEKERIQMKMRSALANGDEEEEEEEPEARLYTWESFKVAMYDHHADLIFLITEYLSDNVHRHLNFKG